MISSCEKEDDNDGTEEHTFEEAITSTTVGRFHYFHLFIAGMCAMSMMVEVSCLSLIMSAAKCDLHFTVYQQGLLGSSGFIGVAIGCQVLGYLADSLGRVKTLRIMLGISICTSLVSAFSVNFEMLMVFRVFTGFFISGCQSCVFSYVAEFHGAKSRVKFIAMTAVFLPIGGVYFPAIAIGVLPLNMGNFSPWRLYLLLNILPSLVACLGLHILPESPKYLLSQGKQNESLNILRSIFSVNTGKSKSLYPCTKLIVLEAPRSRVGFKHLQNKFQTLFSKAIYLQTLNLCFVAFSITFIGTGTYMWLPVIISFLLSNNKSSLTICQAISEASHSKNSTISDCDDQIITLQFEILVYIGVFFVCSYFLISQIITLTGKKRLFVCWLGVNAIASITIYWIQNIYASMVALTIVVAAGNTNSILNAIAADFFPIDVNSLALSIILMSCKVGAVIGTNIFGSILLKYCNQFFFVIGAFLVLLMGCVALLPGKTK